MGSSYFDFGEELVEHIALELFLKRIGVGNLLTDIMPGLAEFSEEARQSQEEVAELVEMEHMGSMLQEKQAVKLNIDSEHGKDCHEHNYRDYNLGYCSSATLA